MRAKSETNPDTCQYNDFALVKLDPADYGKVNPSVPFWGGPVGLNTTGSSRGQSVYSYGNSKLTLGLDVLRRKQGATVASTANGWSYAVATFAPGLPGDSGSANLDASGRARGVLSTLNILPQPPGTNGVRDLRHQLDYLNANGPLTVTLARGTQPFRP